MNFYDLRPQCTEEQYGAEPSIRQLLYNYYFNATFDETFANKHANQYIEKLEKMRREPFEVFISGPNASVLIKLPKDDHTDECTRQRRYERIIYECCMLNADDPDDYTVTILKN